MILQITTKIMLSKHTKCLKSVIVDILIDIDKFMVGFELNKISLQNNQLQIYKGEADWGKANEWYWKGFKSYWRIEGERNSNPLLLIHGFGASSQHWRRNATCFANAGYRVYGLDLIGFGESDQPGPLKRCLLNNHFWAKQIAAFIDEVISREVFAKTILIGNSLGSLVAITTAAYRPELISAVVAAPLPDPALMQSINIFNKLRWLQKLKRKFIFIFFNILPLEVLIPFISRTILIKKALQGAYYSSIKSDKILLRIVTKPAKRLTAARALRSMCIGMSLRPKSATAPLLLEKLGKAEKTLPILLIWGRQDRLIPLRIGNMLIKMHPWLKLLVLNNTGHCPHDESPKEFNKNVLKWLKSNSLNNQNQA